MALQVAMVTIRLAVSIAIMTYYLGCVLMIFGWKKHVKIPITFYLCIIL